MKPRTEFIQVTGSPAGAVGEILIMETDGQEYVIQEVELVTVYTLRKVTPAEALATSHRVPVMDDDLRLVGLKRDLRSRGLHVAVGEMEKHRVRKEKKAKRMKRRAEVE